MGKSISKQTSRVWTKRFVHLFIIETCFQVGLFSTRPLLANFAIFLGAAVTTAATISGLSMIVALFMRPVTGILSDTFDKKLAMVLSAVFFTVGMIGCAFAQSVEAMMFFVALQGVAYSFKSISIIAICVLISPEDRVGSAIGWISILNPLGMAVGPIMGSFLRDVLGYQASFACAAILLAVGGILSVLFKSPDKVARDRKSDNRAKPKQKASLKAIFEKMLYLPAIPITIVGICVNVSNATLSALMLSLSDMGLVESGSLFFVGFAICALASRPISGRLSDSMGTMPVLVPSVIMASIGVGLLAFFHNSFAVFACGALMGLGQASAACVVQAECVRGVSEKMLGRATNTYYFGMDVAVGFGPILSGAIFEGFGFQAMIVANVAILLAGLTIMFAFRAKSKRTATA